MESPESLLPLVQTLFERDPAAAAQRLEEMDETRAAEVLQQLPPALRVEACSHMHPAQAGALLTVLDPEAGGEILERMDPQQAASLVSTLSPQRRAELMERLPLFAREPIRDLLTYPENSAGRIMTLEFVAFRGDTKVRDAIQKIRGLADKQATINYAYVVDEQSRLVGVLNMRDLLLAPGELPLTQVMRTELFAVDAFMDREEVANALSERHYLAAPVVDRQRRLLGVVKSEQLIEHVQAEATEDLQKMVGAGGDEHAFSPIAFSLRKRLPWLYVNLGTAFLAACVVGLFEPLIAQLSVLAVLLPVVAGQGGNAGAQTLAVVIRGLVMREIPPRRARAMIVKEVWIGLVNGVLVGAVTALAVAWWHGSPMLGVVIGLAMVVNLVAAGFSGAAIPLTMKALRLDPAQSSSIIMTTVTDIVGFLSFLGFALMFHRWLVAP